MAQSREALELDTMRRLIHQEIERLEMLLREPPIIRATELVDSRTDFPMVARHSAYREEISFLRGLLEYPMLRIDPKDDVLMERVNEMIRHAAGFNLLDQLFDKLVYLGSYGQDRERPLTLSRCTLACDFAPLSLRFIMEKGEMLSPTEIRWEFWFNGGLVYQGPEQAADGSFPTLTVSLSDGNGWFVHT